jgi:hypothetical protein
VGVCVDTRNNSRNMAEGEVVDPNAGDKKTFSYGIHVAASSTWGDEACARICELVMNANSGLAQQIQDNSTDLMDILETKDLEGPIDDLGITLPFLAVYYDRPEMLEYLRKRGVDLTKYCDPMEYGNPLFYAIHFRRIRIILCLDLLGVSVREPCDSIKTKPWTHAERLDDSYVKEMLTYCFGKEQRASTLVTKHFKRIKTRKQYLFKLKVIPLLLRVMRGMIARAKVRLMRKERDRIARKAARRVVREEKISNGFDLNSDDESTIEDTMDYMF